MFYPLKKHLFSLLGLPNSLHEKEGPAAESEAKFRLEMFRAWFSHTANDKRLEQNTDQSIPRQIFALLWLNKKNEFERFVYCSNFIVWTHFGRETV